MGRQGIRKPPSLVPPAPAKQQPTVTHTTSHLLSQRDAPWGDLILTTRQLVAAGCPSVHAGLTATGPQVFSPLWRSAREHLNTQTSPRGAPMASLGNG